MGDAPLLRGPQVIQDLHEECGKHGTITKVHVPRPPNPRVLAASVFGTGNYGKVSRRSQLPSAMSKAGVGIWRQPAIRAQVWYRNPVRSLAVGSGSRQYGFKLTVLAEIIRMSCSR